VPVASPTIVVDAPVPVVVTPSGFWVMVQIPEAGSPEIGRLPVGIAHVG